MSPTRDAALRIIREQCYRRLPEPIELSSGGMSQDFVDGKEGLARWADLEICCRALVEPLWEAGITFDAAGGLTMGADHLAVGMAAVTDGRWFFVRKEPKGRGTDRYIEGYQVGAGDRVVIVEDATTTGSSALKALDIVEQHGAEAVAAVTLIDRGDRAAAAFAARGVPWFPVATYTDLDIEPVA
jgi:orotate phosphoribosyltransferase